MPRELGYDAGGLILIPTFCSMTLDEVGNVYLTGSGSSQGNYFGFALKYDPLGSLIWEWKLPDQQEESWTGLLVNISRSGAVYGVGGDVVHVGDRGSVGVYVAKRRRDEGGSK